MAPGPWFLYHGPWSLVPGLWSLALVPGLGSLVPWSLVPGPWFLVGPQSLVPSPSARSLETMELSMPQRQNQVKNQDLVTPRLPEEISTEVSYGGLKTQKNTFLGPTKRESKHDRTPKK